MIRENASLDESVVKGPGVGEDAAVIRLGDKLIAAKADPITLATDSIGYYAVAVNANDIACMGARPKWFLATLLLPQTMDEAGIERIFKEAFRDK